MGFLVCAFAVLVPTCTWIHEDCVSVPRMELGLCQLSCYYTPAYLVSVELVTRAVSCYQEGRVRMPTLGEGATGDGSPDQLVSRFGEKWTYPGTKKRLC